MTTTPTMGDIQDHFDREPPKYVLKADHDQASEAIKAIDDDLVISNGIIAQQDKQIAALHGQLAAQAARIAELEQALRLHLAVGPDDPLLIEPVEHQLKAKEREIADVHKANDSVMDELDKIITENEALRQELYEARQAILTEGTQRDALRGALEEAIKVFECEELKGVFTIAHIHGCKYNGPIFDIKQAKALAEGLGKETA